MCDEEVMSLIAEKLGSDLIVIPSSIHETIILKETENVSVTELNAMVEAVNEEAVTPQEKLGNSVYRFDREAQRLEKAVEQAEKHLMPPDYEEVKKILLENAEVTDVKRAAAFFKLIRYSYGSGCTSFGCRPFDVRNCFDTIWQASRRLADTVIENKDFEALIRQYDRDSAFFYCDPPYYETEGHYAVVFRKEDHKRLRDTLTGSRGKWMVSYNDCDFIRELYAGYFITAVTRINNLAQRYEGGCEFPEVIITNYDPGERERSKPRQLDLFGMWGDGETDHYEIREEICPEREVL